MPDYARTDRRAGQQDDAWPDSGLTGGRGGEDVHDITFNKVHQLNKHEIMKSQGQGRSGPKCPHDNTRAEMPARLVYLYSM